MYELGRNIFWAILTELLFVILAIILKDDKRKMIIVLVVGTVLAVIVGLWRSIFSYDLFTVLSNSSPNYPSNSSSDEASSNYLALQSALGLVTTSDGEIYCQGISSSSCAQYYGEATIYNNSPYDLTLRNDKGCYFDSTQTISEQWYIYSGKQVTAICPLIYNSEKKSYDIEILFLYPQSGPNQAGELTVISFQVK